MIEKQIRTDALSSGQFQEEEIGQVLNQREYDYPTKHHIDRCQVKLENDYQTPDTGDKPFVRTFTTSQPPNYHGRSEVEKFPLRTPSGHFQAKADFQTGIVTGSY